jgi:hypothetical protein
VSRKPGHRIRLEMSSRDFPQFAPNSNTGETFGTSAKWQKATQTILHDAAHPSAVIVPVIQAGGSSPALNAGERSTKSQRSWRDLRSSADRFPLNHRISLRNFPVAMGEWRLFRGSFLVSESGLFSFGCSESRLSDRCGLLWTAIDIPMAHRPRKFVGPVSEGANPAFFYRSEVPMLVARVAGRLFLLPKVIAPII